MSSIGFGLPANTAEPLTQIPESVWTPAYDADNQIREGARLVEISEEQRVGVACVPRVPTSPLPDTC